MNNITRLEFDRGYVIITDDAGNKTKQSVLVDLAEIVTIIVKTLIEMNYVEDQFEGDYNLQHIVDVLEKKLGSDW